MDFDLRDWLLILGPVFITGVLVHGYWRMRRGRGDLKMALDKSFINSVGEDDIPGDLTYLKAELPNGGARITSESLPGAQDLDSLQLDENVPVLMESVDLGEFKPEEDATTQVITPEAGAISRTEISEKQLFGSDGVGEVRVVNVSGAGAPPTDHSMGENSDPVDDTVFEQAPVEKAPPAVRSPSGGHPEKFVVVHVASEAFIDGQALLESIVSVGMTFGEMDIFHMEDATGHQLFSLANSVEPGTFIPAEMDQFTTPGVVMFMRVHEVLEPVRVYDQMIEVAMKLCADLGAELQDESRSVMTSQTIEHCRQGILDFQFKYSA